MWKIALALTVTLSGIVALAHDNVTIISDTFRCKLVCIDKMEFLICYGSDSNGNAISTAQVLDANGKPKVCPQYKEE